MEDTPKKIKQVTLDELLGYSGESLSRIQADPDGAWERLLRRHGIDYDKVAHKPIEEIEAGFGVGNNIAPRHYGYRISGNYLMGMERVLTRSDLDTMYQEAMDFMNHSK